MPMSLKYYKDSCKDKLLATNYTHHMRNMVFFSDVQIPWNTRENPNTGLAFSFNHGVVIETELKRAKSI